MNTFCDKSFSVTRRSFGTNSTVLLHNLIRPGEEVKGGPVLPRARSQKGKVQNSSRGKERTQITGTVTQAYLKTIQQLSLSRYHRLKHCLSACGPLTEPEAGRLIVHLSLSR
ncbi:hypothetical protein EPR50_G00037210 [Perca flavescens]|uniref:Uncharacterized protein n=1 Tax=Perca flavescens TaxID=8167 RepID=A0A484DF56_PERFV|nr:hypothetical protein EPR50_G00037210 [Perca flavescens]